MCSAMNWIRSSGTTSMPSTSITANTGLPSTLGSRSAMRCAPSIALTSSVRFTIGTGQNKPYVVCIRSATLSASARFIYPRKGLKYPAPSMTALAAAAELSSSDGNDSASLSNACRVAASCTNNGCSVSEPCGLIILSSRDPMCSAHIRIDDTARGEQLEQRGDFFFQTHFVTVEGQLRLKRRLVRVIDTGKVLDLSGTRFFI